MYSGGDGSAGNPYQIANATDFYDIRSNLNKEFIQTADISLSGYANWSQFTNFTGVYDGGNYEITNLASTGGGICIQITAGTFKNIIIKGTVTKDSALIGGLANQCIGGTFDNIRSEVNVSYASTKRDGVGGIIGRLSAESNTTFNKCMATGTIVGKNYVGGAIGQSEYKTGATTNIFKDCYSTASVTSEDIGGGFVGSAWVLNASVTTTFQNCYSFGTVTNTGATKGGFCASSGSTNNPIVATNNFYDTTVTGLSDTTLATPKTTAQLKTQSTFTDWDFTTPIWIMDLTNLEGYPNLKWYYDLLPKPKAEIKNIKLSLGMGMGL